MFGCMVIPATGWPGDKSEIRQGHFNQHDFELCMSRFGARSGETLLDAARRAAGNHVDPATRFAAELVARSHDRPAQRPRTGETNAAVAAWNTMASMAIMLSDPPPTDPRLIRLVSLYLVCLCDDEALGFSAPCPGCAFQMEHA